MIDTLQTGISGLLAGGGAAAPLLALVAGLLTSLLPCSLSTVPLIIGYVGGGKGEGGPRRALRLSLVFAAGMALTFTALGVAAALAGRLLFVAGRWWYLFLGALMLLMALQSWGVIPGIPATYLTSKNTRRGYLGALVAGILGGLFSSPCATPALVVLLGLVAGGGSPAYGAVLLLCYSLGHSALAVVAGTSAGFVQRLGKSPGYGRWARVVNILLGAAMLALSLYFFYLGF